MQHSCRQCQAEFEVTHEDLAFYERVSPVFGDRKELVPPPQLCPDCQHQRRLARRNERFLHRRTCNLTGREIVSFYSSRKPWTVYAPDAWWSDQWDPLSYGRPCDRSKPFFEQFADLMRVVPRIGMVVSHCENCDYAPYSVYSRNCYLSPSNIGSEDLCYCYQTNDSHNCVDCSLCTRCELCSECLCCIGLHRCTFCQNCESSQNLSFCKDCRNCTDCIACKNLMGKQHYLFNRQVTPEEIRSIREKLQKEREREAFAGKVADFFRTLPERGLHLINCENCTGDNLTNCRNAHECFDATGLEDCTYCYTMPKGAKDSRGVHYSPNAELVYDSLSAVNGYRVQFALHSWDCKECLYVDECFYCEHCFGCIGLRHKEYCILNTQYTKQEYEALVPKMIEHMRKTGEWGEYFPITTSPFAYNETIAMERCPLGKKEVLERSWQWEEQVDEPPKVEKVFDAELLPDAIEEIPDDILNWATRCHVTKRPYRVVRPELQFYRTMQLPVPRFHPDERHRRRMALRNPRKLWDRQCANCSKPIRTSYAPERPEIVYCESCYINEVY